MKLEEYTDIQGYNVYFNILPPSKIQPMGALGCEQCYDFIKIKKHCSDTLLGYLCRTIEKNTILLKY